MTGPGDMLEMPVEKAPFHSMSRTYLLGSWYNTCKKLLTFCMCHLALFALTKGLYDITVNVNLKFTSLLNQDVMVSRCTSFDTDKHYTYYIDMYRKGGPPLHYYGQKIVDRLITGARISEGHALVADRFFTSVATAEALRQRAITFTGTCQERRRFVPKILTKQEMRRNPEIVEMSSLTVFSENMSMTGYIPARHYHRNFKVVLVLSTEYQLHQQVNS